MSICGDNKYIVGYVETFFKNGFLISSLPYHLSLSSCVFMILEYMDFGSLLMLFRKSGKKKIKERIIAYIIL
jgi:serine/threonine protein kinase